jgi:sec-independent protein translocase protein TatB
MLDVGWTELLVIAVVLIVVVGPKDLPPMLRAFGRMVTKMRGVASDFRQQFDEALREADLDDVRKTIADAQKLNPLNTIRDAVNPLRKVGDEIKSDLQKATSTVSTPVTAEPADVSVGEPVAVPSEANKPASTEPVAAVPLKAGPVAKTEGKAAAKPRKTAEKAASAAKAETKAAAKSEPKAAKAAPAKKSTTTKPKSTSAKPAIKAAGGKSKKDKGEA